MIFGFPSSNSTVNVFTEDLISLDDLLISFGLLLLFLVSFSCSSSSSCSCSSSSSSSIISDIEWWKYIVTAKLTLSFRG